MDMLFGDTVTLYNHYKNKWYRTVLAGVQWVSKVTKTVDSDGKMHVTPEIGVTVPYRSGYVPPKKYTGEGFTFGLDNLDVINRLQFVNQFVTLHFQCRITCCHVDSE